MNFPPAKIPLIIHFSNKLVNVIVPVVVAPFAFLQMAYEILRRASVELGEPPLREAPEALYPVGMALASCELVLAVKYPVVIVSIKNQTTVLSMVREIVFGVGFALLLPLVFGLDGVLYSMPLSDILTSVIAVFLIIKTYKQLNQELIKHA